VERPAREILSPLGGDAAGHLRHQE